MDDLIYAGAISASLVLGYFVRAIKNPDVKQWTGTVLGCLFVLSVTKRQIWYPLLLFALNIVVIKFVHLRLVYINIMFTNFRMRMYCAFVLSECTCIIAGLGAYPCDSKPYPGHGPTIRTPKNFVKEWEVEFSTTVKMALRNWNSTVQYWLVVVVYKQSPKLFRAMLTMVVSAIWHGIHPGYYLAMLIIPLVLLVESRWQHEETTSSMSLVKWLQGFIFTSQCFAYFGVGFLLLRVDITLYFWHSVYFYGHIILLLLGTASLWRKKQMK